MESNTELQQTQPQSLIALAIEKGTSIDQLEKLMDLQERWQKQQAKKSFLNAICNFQSVVPAIEKSKKIDFQTKSGGRLNYSYAELGEIAETIKNPLKENGISYRWEIAEAQQQISVTCIISHIDGHSENTTMTSEKDDSGQKNNIQQKASAITYLQRYTLIAALGLTTANADVDGHHSEPPFNIHTSVIQYGKNKGKLYKELPIDYLQWILKEGKPEEKDKAQKVIDCLHNKNENEFDYDMWQDAIESQDNIELLEKFYFSNKQTIDSNKKLINMMSVHKTKLLTAQKQTA